MYYACPGGCVPGRAPEDARAEMQTCPNGCARNVSQRGRALLRVPQRVRARSTPQRARALLHVSQRVRAKHVPEGARVYNFDCYDYDYC